MANPADARGQLVVGGRDDNERITTFRYLGRRLRVRFALANTSYEVVHGLGSVPDGMTLTDWDCAVKRTPGKPWTDTVAYLQSDTANSFCDVIFGFCREEVQLVQAS